MTWLLIRIYYLVINFSWEITRSKVCKLCFCTFVSINAALKNMKLRNCHYKIQMHTMNIIDKTLLSAIFSFHSITKLFWTTLIRVCFTIPGSILSKFPSFRVSNVTTFSFCMSQTLSKILLRRSNIKDKFIYMWLL